jgi:imidazolonepropionase-like amidohydrolase
VRCERSEDILNALELAEEFSLRLVIDGGTEAYLVCKDLAKANAPVVLGRATGRDYFKDDALQRRLPEGAAVLSEKGVEWHVGSGGGDPLGSRFVLMNAELTGAQVEGKDALTLVTTDAADFLGVGEKMGRLSPGRAADFVVWSGDPLDPASRVDEVYVGGELVYRAPELQGGER